MFKIHTLGDEQLIRKISSKVFATQKDFTGRRSNLQSRLELIQNRHIECAATKIEHESNSFLL